ncbi:MAG TPA: uroporphyrinogen decarboxylase family protein [Methylomirabilota bacterium]|nr:uroporphyrinogen decarboxylase family protein [Methylomirabilota bacterium]
MLEPALRSPMSRRERVAAAVARAPVDRSPYAFWRRFPAVDRSPAGLAQATLRFHDRYGPDLLIVVPPAGYAAQAWGCVEGDLPGPDGARPCARCAVQRPEDWRGIRAVDPAAAPGYTDVLEALVRIGFDRRIGDAPVLITLPAPLTVAARLAGGRLGLDLREWPGLVRDALAAIAETQRRFAERCLAEGLAGVAYVLEGWPDVGETVYAELGEPADREVLSAVGDRALRVVHVSGPLPFARVAALAADVLGWAPGGSLPDLAGGHAALRGAVLGGLDARALREDSPEAARRAARAAVTLVERGLIVAPGGPVWPETPDATLTAVVRELGGSTRPILGITR